MAEEDREQAQAGPFLTTGATLPAQLSEGLGQTAYCTQRFQQVRASSNWARQKARIKSTPGHPAGSTTQPPHLTAIEADPGLLAVGEHLPQRDPKHPGVAGMGEGARLQALWGTPGRGRGQIEGLSENPRPCSSPSGPQMLLHKHAIAESPGSQ